MIKRRQVRIKDFLILAWWDTNAKLTWEENKFAAEVHYERTGKYKIVYADSKRELVKQVRLQCAIFKNPQIAKVIDRLEGKEDPLDKMFQAQQLVAQKIAQQRGIYIGQLQGPRQPSKQSLISSILGDHASRIFGGGGKK